MAGELEVRVRPFYCGSQGADWQVSNCDNCQKRGHYTNGKTDWVWQCDIQQAVDFAYVSDGKVSAPIAARMGFEKDRYGWRCNELIPVMPIAEYFASIAPPKTKLAPLRLRLGRSLRAAWIFWIKPWDREDHDCYEGLRSPWLAWSVAWGIHDDDQVMDGRQ
jgi:hypothetical protein